MDFGGMQLGSQQKAGIRDRGGKLKEEKGVGREVVKNKKGGKASGLTVGAPEGYL